VAHLKPESRAVMAHVLAGGDRGYHRHELDAAFPDDRLLPKRLSNLVWLNLLRSVGGRGCRGAMYYPGDRLLANPALCQAPEPAKPSVQREAEPAEPQAPRPVPNSVWALGEIALREHTTCA
jgi:hypothetical protein